MARRKGALKQEKGPGKNKKKIDRYRVVFADGPRKGDTTILLALPIHQEIRVANPLWCYQRPTEHETLCTYRYDIDRRNYMYVPRALASGPSTEWAW
jgi:hypothetical protein